MKMAWQNLLVNSVPREGENGGNPPPPPPPKPWFDGKLDAEHTGHLQNLGLHDKPLEEVAITALKSHRAAEKLLGVPKNELLRFKPGDETITKEFWSKLGTPAEAKDYDFPALKSADGKVTDERLEASLRDTAFKLHLPKDTAAQVAESVVKTLQAQRDEQVAASTATLATEKTALADLWKANAPANMVVAKAGAAKLGLSAVEVDALEKTVGYAKTMEALRRVGALSGEDQFIRNDSNFNGGVMTADQAKAKITELKADKEWIKRWQNGGAAEKREFDSLTALMAG